MKNLLCIPFLIILFTCISSNAFGTHTVTGEIQYYDMGTAQNGDRLYFVRMLMTRDALNSQVGFDQNPKLGVYREDSGMQLSQVLTLNLTNQYSDLSLYACFDQVPEDVSKNQNFYHGIYEGFLSVKPSLKEIIVTYDLCCKTIGENTTENQQGNPFEGMQLTCTIPPSSVSNDAATSLYQNLLVSNTGDTISVQFPMQDDEGDSLAINVLAPQVGQASDVNPLPEPSNTYIASRSILYQNGYSLSRPYGANGLSRMNSDSNVYSFFTPNVGRHFIAFQLKEYRNGVNISTRNFELILEAFESNIFLISQSNKPRKLVGEYISGPKAISLKWVNCLSNVSKHEVYRSTNGGPFTKIGETPDIIYTDVNVNAGNTYNYYIKGIPSGSVPSGVSDTTTIDLSGLSTTKIAIDKSISIYPNPTRRKLTINAEFLIEKIIIRDIQGQLVYEQSEILAHDVNLDLKKCSDGIYFITCHGDNKHLTKKLIIE